MSSSRKQSSPISLIVAYVFCTLSLLAVPPAAILLPRVVEHYLTRHDPAAVPHTTAVTALLYIGLFIATVVLILLFALLRVARRNAIFTPVSARLVAAIAWLVVAEGGVFALLALYLLPVFALAVTVVSLVLGSCLLVVSHVLRAATLLKEENDGTI